MEGDKDKTSEEEIKEFTCENCMLREKYEYFGKEPPYNRKFKYLEEVYAIENPFQPPRQGEILILGSHCIQCNKSVCKDQQCSFFYEGTYCIQCAKGNEMAFPKPVQEKLNKIVL